VEAGDAVVTVNSARRWLDVPELRRATTPDLWITQPPTRIHLISGESLVPHRASYVAWANAEGGIASLRWVVGGFAFRDPDGSGQRIELTPGSFWRVVPGGAIAYLDFEDDS
jgi:hypothetical protein